MVDILANTGRSLLGIAEKARINILDRRGYDINVEVVETKEAEGKKSYNLSSVGSAVPIAATGVLDVDLKSAMSVMSANLDMLNMGKRTYIVSINPSSLSISAIGGGRFSKNNYSGGEGKSTTSDFSQMNTRIQLDVKLIFDNGYSVKEDVEAFIAALREERTREVEFSWGKMLYCGIMNMVDVTYTMFSKAGRPVRAEMNVSMLCVDEGLAAGEESSWSKHYKDAFNESVVLGGLGQKLTQVTNNLINI